MANKNLKEKSGVLSQVRKESRVEWAKILVAVAAGLVLGLIIAVAFAGKENLIQLIPQALDIVLLACVLALLLDIRRLLIHMAKA